MLGDLTTVTFDTLHSVSLKPGVYGIPKARNFAVLDSVAPPNAYQMTVSLLHNCAAKQSAEMVDAGYEKLIFVVPDDNASKFKRQSFVTSAGTKWKLREPQLRQYVFGPVSYTHLTLPTIYSV
eukprot:TRINITY_DN1772_c0_g1_i3.p1 TRINITY_DN1772_c0_g1~~TRINITY_DN1772_c0_g1_i3.p1  ORF type:complete len:123 (+),score=28.70 TRINITY_DN1772_c0_g1_i3:274-642(+)